MSFDGLMQASRSESKPVRRKKPGVRWFKATESRLRAHALHLICILILSFSFLGCGFSTTNQVREGYDQKATVTLRAGYQDVYRSVMEIIIDEYGGANTTGDLFTDIEKGQITARHLTGLIWILAEIEQANESETRVTLYTTLRGFADSPPEIVQKLKSIYQ